MSQGLRGLDWLPGVLAGTVSVAIVVSYQQAASALTFAEVRKIAVPVTVMISAQNGGGSGVIVAKQGNTYTVLTNRHVAEEDTAYRIQTSDSDVHEAVRVVKRFQDVDLAVLQFDSVKNYPVATLGNSGLSSVGDTVFSFGYPGIYVRKTNTSEQRYRDSEGIVLDLNAQNNQGYLIKHRADTPRGMSGGPTFDAKGRLIAINGLVGIKTQSREIPPEIDEKGQIPLYEGKIELKIYTGEYFSIPINTAIAQLAKAGISVSNLKVDKTPPPNNRERIANPKNAGDYYLRASIARQKGDIQAAINDYSKAIELDSNFIDAYFSRGLAWEAKDFPKAIADFDEIIARPSGDLKIYAYNNRGATRADLGDKQGALEDYTQAIRLDPKSAAAYYSRGIVRFNLGDKQGAIEDSTQAIRLASKFAAAYSNRGVV
ncbi:MAG: tetratricopeptide repeat-containing serine protease family protein, partial [Phormidesmis sp. CAN_BIN44]|nr:tetratricopeptide repeat-containing serine protease family protein [Phormidesmis sp. CAN_BIN44]